MNGPRRFAANHFHDPWMRVAQRIDGNAAQKIEVLFPVSIVDVASLPAFQQKRLALVSRQQKFLRFLHARIHLRGREFRSPVL